LSRTRTAFGVLAEIDLGEGPDVDVCALLEMGDGEFRLTGMAELGHRQFHISIVSSDDHRLVVGSFDTEGDPARLDIRDLALSISPDIGDLVPSLVVELNRAVFVMTRSAIVFGAEFGLKIDLTELPVVGPQVARSGDARLDELQVLVTSTELDANLREAIVSSLHGTHFSLPIPDNPAEPTPAGPVLSGRLHLGGHAQSLALPLRRPSLAKSDHSPAPKAPNAPSLPVRPPPNDDAGGVTWMDLNKTFGPVTVARIGYRMGDGDLSLLIDAGFMLGPLALSVDGLGVSNPLDRFDPTFELKGLKLGFTSGPVKVSGALLYDRADGSFVGMASITLPSLSITAMGGYQKVDGQASLFLYAVLNRPLGGPAFFFVTGLALGFGYNRRLVLPPAEGVPSFPFVQAAMGPPGPTDPLSTLRKLTRILPAKRGEMFFAVGIKFTSFKLLDSFALLIVRIGQELTINLLGITRLSVPPELPPGRSPLAQAELALEAEINVTKGTILVRGVLTENSFVLTRACRLTGGFAFAAWLAGEHEGDFVVTLGGYHPDYPVPKWYPEVPRLGLRWRVSRNVTISGSIYMALTPNAVMAGGEFSAVYKSGNLNASFEMGAHFLFSWQPYYYRASMYVRFRCSYTFTLDLGFLGTIRKSIRVSIGASLELWGPEFGGTATVDLSVVSFTVNFGARKRQVSPIDWSEFEKAFLPPAADRLSLSVTRGLAEERENLTIVNPAELEVELSTVLPVKTTGAAFGISSMDLKKVHTSSMDVVITRNGRAFDEMQVTPITRNAPAALWGRSLDAAKAKESLMRDLTLGYRLQPAPPLTPEKSAIRPVSDFAFDLQIHDAAFAPVAALPPPSAGESYNAVSAALQSPGPTDRRAALLSSLGLDASTIDCSRLIDNAAEVLVRIPQAAG